MARHGKLVGANSEHGFFQLRIPRPVADPDTQQSLVEIPAADASLLLAIDTDDGAKLRQIIDHETASPRFTWSGVGKTRDFRG